MRVRRCDEEIANEKYAHLQFQSGDDMLIVALLITDDSSWGEERDDI